jgi:hypothetical protein
MPTNDPLARESWLPTSKWGLGVIVYTADGENRARGPWGWSGAWGSHLSNSGDYSIAGDH